MTDWPWPNFTRAEMACKCGCGKADMVAEFMDRLQMIRTNIGIPLTVTSAYRCPAHNARVSSTGRDGPHTTGRAVDIAIRGADGLRLVETALRLGMTGVGVNQKGASRFIHLDDLETPRPNIWSY